MSGPTVLESPLSFDYFTLDGQRSPGVSKIASGGLAKEKIQDQQQPLTTGANTVVQMSENAIVTYELRLWLPGHLQTWNRWEAMFLEGRKRRPPRAYTIVDLRYSWVTKVIFEAMEPQKTEAPGGPWSRGLVLHQWVKTKPYGGPIKPGFLDSEITAQSAKVERLTKQLASSNELARQKAGK